MLHLDHYDLIAQNFYEATFKISQETGLGNFDGGWFPRMGVGTRMIPLGGDQFLEVAGFCDTEAFKQAGGGFPFDKLLAHRQAFLLWAFRTDSLEELEELARACGWGVDREILNEEGAQVLMNGERGAAIIETPVGFEAIQRGMPQVYFWPDLNRHDSRFPIEKGTGDGRNPQGVSWIEVGGTADQLESWFHGVLRAKDYPIRFDGKSPGLHAIAVATSKGEVVIRRPYGLGSD